MAVFQNPYLTEYFSSALKVYIPKIHPWWMNFIALISKCIEFEGRVAWTTQYWNIDSYKFSFFLSASWTHSPTLILLDQLKYCVRYDLRWFLHSKLNKSIGIARHHRLKKPNAVLTWRAQYISLTVFYSVLIIHTFLSEWISMVIWSESGRP